MNFTKTTSYSLKVLTYMAKNTGHDHTALSLSKDLKIPRHYLRTLLTTLTKRKLIKSNKGRGGGIMLSRKPDRIFLSDIVEAMEGLNVFKTCIVGFTECPLSGRCKLHPVWAETRKKITKILETTSLADFAKKSKQS